jgi:hypothetical protein
MADFVHEADHEDVGEAEEEAAGGVKEHSP